MTWVGKEEDEVGFKLFLRQITYIGHTSKGSQVELSKATT